MGLKPLADVSNSPWWLVGISIFHKFVTYVASNYLEEITLFQDTHPNMPHDCDLFSELTSW